MGFLVVALFSYLLYLHLVVKSRKKAEEQFRKREAIERYVTSVRDSKPSRTSSAVYTKKAVVTPRKETVPAPASSTTVVQDSSSNDLLTAMLLNEMLHRNSDTVRHGVDSDTGQVFNWDFSTPKEETKVRDEPAPTSYSSSYSSSSDDSSYKSSYSSSSSDSSYSSSYSSSSSDSSYSSSSSDSSYSSSSSD